VLLWKRGTKRTTFNCPSLRAFAAATRRSNCRLLALFGNHGCPVWNIQNSRKRVARYLTHPSDDGDNVAAARYVRVDSGEAGCSTVGEEYVAETLTGGNHVSCDDELEGDRCASVAGLGSGQDVTHLDPPGVSGRGAVPPGHWRRCRRSSVG